MKAKMDPPPPSESIREDKEKGKDIAVLASPASGVAVPEPIKPLLQALSPSTKRRQSTEAQPSGSLERQNITPKRVRPPQSKVKLLPAKYEFCEVEDMVVLIANMISELIHTNDELPLRSGVLTRFHSRYVKIPLTHKW